MKLGIPPGPSRRMVQMALGEFHMMSWWKILHLKMKKDIPSFTLKTAPSMRRRLWKFWHTTVRTEMSARSCRSAETKEAMSREGMTLVVEKERANVKVPGTTLERAKASSRRERATSSPTRMTFCQGPDASIVTNWVTCPKIVPSRMTRTRNPHLDQTMPGNSF